MHIFKAGDTVGTLSIILICFTKYFLIFSIAVFVLHDCLRLSRLLVRFSVSEYGSRVQYQWWKWCCTVWWNTIHNSEKGFRHSQSATHPKWQTLVNIEKHFWSQNWNSGLIRPDSFFRAQSFLSWDETSHSGNSSCQLWITGRLLGHGDHAVHLVGGRGAASWKKKTWSAYSSRKVNEHLEFGMQEQNYLVEMWTMHYNTQNCFRWYLFI